MCEKQNGLVENSHHFLLLRAIQIYWINLGVLGNHFAQNVFFNKPCFNEKYMINTMKFLSWTKYTLKSMHDMLNIKLPKVLKSKTRLIWIIISLNCGIVRLFQYSFSNNQRTQSINKISVFVVKISVKFRYFTIKTRGSCKHKISVWMFVTEIIEKDLQPHF